MAEIGTTRQLSPLLPDSVVSLASIGSGASDWSGSSTAAAAIVLIAAGAFVVGRKSRQRQRLRRRGGRRAGHARHPTPRR